MGGGVGGKSTGIKLGINRHTGQVLVQDLGDGCKFDLHEVDVHLTAGSALIIDLWCRMRAEQGRMGGFFPASSYLRYLLFTVGYNGWPNKPSPFISASLVSI
jgi:hypothetical protein